MFKHTFHRRDLFQSYTWAILLSALVVGVSATLVRATLNVTGALIAKPDIAVLLLLPQERITDSELLRAHDDTRDYLIQTHEGPKLAKLKRGQEWYVSELIQLHSTGPDPVTENTLAPLR